MSERLRPWRVLVDVAPEVLRDVLEHQLQRPDVVIVRGGLHADGPYDVKITNPAPSDSESSTMLELRLPMHPRARLRSGALEQVVALDVRDVAAIRRMLDVLCPPTALT